METVIACYFLPDLDLLLSGQVFVTFDETTMEYSYDSDSEQTVSEMAYGLFLERLPMESASSAERSSSVSRYLWSASFQYMGC
jgi:hypothetical protein